MKKRQKGLSFTWKGEGTCSLYSAKSCKDAHIIIPERVFLKGKVDEIEEYAFHNNANIKSVIIPEGVVSIGTGAFEGCVNLESLILPQSLQAIEKCAFMNCTSLKNIRLPPLIRTIHEDTFYGCRALESIHLDHIESIGKRAFMNCSSLHNVTPNKKLTYIDSSSFRNSKCCVRYGGLIYVDNWIVGCSQSEVYTIKSDTVGIAEDVFAQKETTVRTRNPEYDKQLDDYMSVIECCSYVPPELYPTAPEYLEEKFPLKFTFEGALEDFRKIRILPGNEHVDVTITADDGVLQTKLK